MARDFKIDREILQAALVGLQHQRSELEAKMAEIRRAVGSPVSPPSSTAADSTQPRAKRQLSAAARKSIAEAQKKRWAAFHAGKEEPAPAKKERKISAAGRKRIAQATKKRWAAFRAKQAAASAQKLKKASAKAARKADKPVKRVAAKPARQVAAPATGQVQPAAEE